MPGVIDVWDASTFELGLLEVLRDQVDMPTAQMKERYERHRRRLPFTAFKRFEARQVWGVKTAIELS